MSVIWRQLKWYSKPMLVILLLTIASPIADHYGHKYLACAWLLFLLACAIVVTIADKVHRQRFDPALETAWKDYLADYEELREQLLATWRANPSPTLWEIIEDHNAKAAEMRAKLEKNADREERLRLFDEWTELMASFKSQLVRWPAS